MFFMRNGRVFRLKTLTMMDEIRLPRKAFGLRQNASGDAGPAMPRPAR
jgi:hypothetical protein